MWAVLKVGCYGVTTTGGVWPPSGEGKEARRVHTVMAVLTLERSEWQRQPQRICSGGPNCDVRFNAAARGAHELRHGCAGESRLLFCFLKVDHSTRTRAMLTRICPPNLIHLPDLHVMWCTRPALRDSTQATANNS